MPCLFRKSVWIVAGIVSASTFLTAADNAGWKSLIPQIREVLRQTFHGERIEESYSIAIIDEMDVTGDHVPEAVVYLGTGGASTDEVTLLRFENGSPVVQKFKEMNGAVGTHIFLRGASVMHSDGFSLVPEKHAVYSLSSRNDSEGKLAECTVIAYEWNNSTKTFDWNRALSFQIKRKVCPKLVSVMP